MTREKIQQPSALPWLAARRNILGLTLGFFLLIAAGFFFLSYRHYQDAKDHRLSDDLASARLVSLIVETYLSDIRSTMESYAHRPLLIRAVRQKNIAEAGQHLANLNLLNPSMDRLLITDPAGTLWVNLPHLPDVIGKNFAFRDWYRGVSREWKPYIGEAVLRVTAEKDTAVHIAVPVADEKGNIVGILLNTLRAVEIGKILQRIPLEEGLSVSLADRRGTLLYSSRYPYEKALSPCPFFAVAVKAAQTFSTVSVADPGAGGAVRYISGATVTGTGWHVFIGRDRRLMLTRSSDYFFQIAAISLLLFLCIVLLLAFIRKRALAQSALEALQAGKDVLDSRMRFSELFNHLHSGVAVYQAVDGGKDFLLVELNAAARRITKEEQDVRDRSVRDVYPGLANHPLLETFQRVWQTGKPEEHPTFYYSDDKQAFWTDNYVFRLPAGEVVSVFDDVTGRKQAEDRIARQTRLLTAINRLFAETLKSDSSETVARTCLAAAQEITSSAFGFIGEVNSAGLFNTTSISNPGWEACALDKSAATAAITNMAVRGIWGQVILREQAFIVNHPDSFPQRIGLPEGHPPITSFLGVPLRDQGKTIGMMALANRVGGYTDEQREDLEALAVSFVEAMRRNRAEEKVKNMYQELEKRVIERTEALVAKTSELERINRVFVDRELKMRELKARIAEMEKRCS